MGAGAVPKWACMVIFCVMILTLEVLGGMNSVVLTDAWKAGRWTWWWWWMVMVKQEGE